MTVRLPPSIALDERVRRAIRRRPYSPRTGETYLTWIRRYVAFHGGGDPATLGSVEVRAFITDLVATRQVSASTQSQALSALSFLYRDVLNAEIERVRPVRVHAAPRRPPVVFSRPEVAAILAELRGAPRLVVSLLYGAGLRMREALDLRVKDVDLDRRQITVRRRAAHGRERVTIVPEWLRAPLAAHLDGVCRQHRADLAAGLGRAPLPQALERRFPHAAGEWPWQFVFPATRLSRSRSSGLPCRAPLPPAVVERAVLTAMRRAGVGRRATCQAFRHSCAAHLLADGHALGVVQQLMGHADAATTLACAAARDESPDAPPQDNAAGEV